MGYVQGVDVSHWQPEIVWPELYRAGYRFAFIKATEGDYFTDKTYRRKMDGAKDSGFLRSPYHFWRNQGWVAQYDHFMRTIDKDPGELPPMLDCEIDGMWYDYIYKLAEKLASTLGRWPINYSSVRYWKDKTKRWLKCPLMVADWTGSVQIPLPYQEYAFHQYRVSDKGEVPGVPGARCDLDYFKGDEAELALFAGGITLPEPPVEPPVVVPDGAGPKYRVTADLLNIRDAPRLSARSIGMLVGGTVVDSYGYHSPTEGWIEIKPGQWAAQVYNGRRFMERVE
jgi:lysozyme